MSDTLDEKLKAFITQDTMAYEKDERVAELKQIFAEAGYVHVPQGEVGTVEGIEIMSINGDSNIMSGQQWYDRFVKVIDGDLSIFPDTPQAKKTPDELALDIYWRTKQAAKRAAGIEESHDTPA